MQDFIYVLFEFGAESNRYLVAQSEKDHLLYSVVVDRMTDAALLLGLALTPNH